MKAIILVGGFGTRLRPLTLTKPKPLVEFCNVPILEHQIQALVAVGVKLVVLAVSYKPHDMTAFVQNITTKYMIDVIVSVEPEPLGTGGGVGYSAHLLLGDEPFFCFNSDITCDYPLAQMLQFHNDSRANATMLITRVEEPSKYGVVVTNDKGRVDHFVEKPQTFVSSFINAGIYLMEPSVLDLVGSRVMSLEKDVFPHLANDKRLFAMPIEGFWMDIGQPRDYVFGTRLYLAHLAKTAPSLLSQSDDIMGNCLVDPTATIEPGALLGPNCVVGPRCVVKTGARVVNSVLLEGAVVESFAFVSDSILGWNSTAHKWAHIASGCVTGEDVQIGSGCALNGAIVLPHKSIQSSVWATGQILM